MIGLLFNWRIWAVVAIAVALAASHWKVYTSGKKSVQADWDAATLLANDTARETERLNRMTKEKALDERTKEIVGNVAAERRNTALAASLLGSSERSLQAARGDHAACLVAASAHAELFGECRSALATLGSQAQGHVADVKALIAAWPK